MSTLKTTSWLFKNLNNTKLVILNASKNLEKNQVPNSIYFDIKNVFSNTTSTLPNTFPKTEEFEKNVQNLGINKDSIIVVYDDKGIYFSPRVWWLFQTFGFKNIYVLDGGLPQWKKEQLPLEKENLKIHAKGNFKAELIRENVIKFDKIIKNIISKDFQIIDARASGRFNGTIPESRKGLKSGHIPNSVNLPYTLLLDNGKMKSKSEIQLIFNGLNLPNKPFVFSCGSGITACILLLASKQIGFDNLFIYDGSWTEYSTLMNED